MTEAFVIAIDGPAASGKGTLARKLAAHFGFAYLDTGKLYRAVALKLLERNETTGKAASAINAAQNLTPEDLKDPRLSEERVGQMASLVSSIPEVRAALLAFQQQFARNANGAVLDGRDIGTVICPDARIKLFIVADIQVRAERRYKELQAKNPDISYEAVVRDLEARDARDSNRAAAPLTMAPDALRVDTSLMNAEQAFTHVLQLISEHI